LAAWAAAAGFRRHGSSVSPKRPSRPLYLLGQQDRVVGISGYIVIVRPPEARREKPRVSAFTSANIDEEARSVVAREPDLIIGSWCGKKFQPERVKARPGFDRTQAVRRQDVYEIKSPLILQPGLAALTDGLQQLHNIIQAWPVFLDSGLAG
jgi:iron complex transport system substrate-binding protein